MQKGSGHSVAVVRLRFFSYTAVGGSQYLHPLQVRTVRQSEIPALRLNVRLCYCSFIAAFRLTWTLFTWFMLSSQSASVFPLVRVCQSMISSIMQKPKRCTGVSFMPHADSPFLSRDSSVCVYLSLSPPSFLGTGEEREELWRGSSCPSAQALCRVAPCQAPAHTVNCSADLCVSEPRSRWERCGSRSSGSPRLPRRGLATRPRRRQHGQLYRGPQQVSGAEKNVKWRPGSIVASFIQPLISPRGTFTSVSQHNMQ